jgi:hypothetical protein
MRLEGEAARSVTVFAQMLELPAQGRVGADLLAFAQEANLDGSIVRDALTFSENISVRGKIGRDLSSYSDRITLAAPAAVSGNFTARVRKKERVQIGDGVVISGKTDVQVRAKRSRYARPGFYIWQAITLVGAWLVGCCWRHSSLLLSPLLPRAARNSRGEPQSDFWCWWQRRWRPLCSR